MKIMPIIAVARYFGGWAIIVFFIALLTFIFSFLGTILCAVLAGMMFGAVRSVWWKTLAASAVFPGVLLGVLLASKTEMLSTQIMLLALLCFGTFWGTYWLALALFCYERKGQQSSAKVEAQAQRRSPAAGLNLTVLQGNWSCRNGSDSEFHE